jgi:hypothetical protein
MDKYLERKLEIISTYGTRMVDLYFHLGLRLETLCSFSNESLIASLNNSNGAHVYNSLTTVLSTDIVRELCALVLDKAHETLSVRNVWRLAQRPGLMSVLRDRCLAADRSLGAQFDEAAGRLVDIVPTLLESSRARWLQAFIQALEAVAKMQKVSRLNMHAASHLTCTVLSIIAAL